MTDFKRRTLHLMTGKQIRLYGNSMAIGSSLEIGEGSAPNIFSYLEREVESKKKIEIPPEKEENEVDITKKVARKKQAIVQNPHQLSAADLLEIADYNIQLWQDLKRNIRKYGVEDPRVFDQESSR